jgi:hypothetical protein
MTSKLQENSPALKREHPKLQNMKVSSIFFFFCGSFLPPGSGPGSSRSKSERIWIRSRRRRLAGVTGVDGEGEAVAGETGARGRLLWPLGALVVAQRIFSNISWTERTLEIKGKAESIRVLKKYQKKIIIIFLMSSYVIYVSELKPHSIRK